MPLSLAGGPGVVRLIIRELPRAAEQPGDVHADDDDAADDREDEHGLAEGDGPAAGDPQLGA